MEVFILGTAGYAQVVADSVVDSVSLSDRGDALPLRCIGRVGPREHFVDGRLSSPWLGDDAVLEELPRSACFALGVGAPRLRQTLWELASGLGFPPVPACRHSSSVVARSVEAGEGTVLLPLSNASSNVRLAAAVHVSVAAVIGHDAVVGRFSTINPQATVSGHVIVGEGVLIGAQAVILEGRTIGDGARVGAGAVVTRDVPPGATVVGNPARVVGRP